MFKKTILYIQFLLLSINFSKAQNATAQLWNDFIVNAPLQKGFTLNTEFSYRTTLNKNDKWSSYSVTPNIGKSFSKRVDAMLYFGVFYTHQQTAFNTWELRPGIGVRYHITTNKRILLGAILRFEQRNFYFINTENWTHNIRSRLKLESTSLLNGNSFAQDGLWYIVADAEVFWIMDNQLEERYVNRVRFQAGFGYKLNNKWRFEAIYCYQLSKTNIKGEFYDNSQDIIRFRIKYWTK